MQEESRVARRLAELVAFDTRNPDGDERPLADRLARELANLGAATVEVFRTDRHVSTFARFGQDPPSLILNAHIDTVPINSGYTTDPFALTRRGARWHGLGSADTKGAIAAILEALTRVKESGQAPAGVAVLFSGDEELGGACMRRFLASDRVRGIERAIVCEPTGCRVGVRHRGVYAATIEASSPGGHSSLADSVPNPLAALARAAVALDDLGARCRELGPPGLRGLCMNVAALDGGKAFNIIPTHAKLTFSIRPAPGVDVPGVVAQAREVATQAAAPLGIRYADLTSNPAFETRDPAGFFPLLGERARNPIDLPFGTEAGQFVEKGIDTVVFGPGHIEQAHKADEFVEGAELEDAATAMTEILGRCGAG